MSETLKPWYAIAIPHEDIRKGRLDESVFAANVWAVAQGKAPHVYLDPVEFYEKTYMTTGLSTILKRVGTALSDGGEIGDRIISLQTAFGGGKTHALVALWHLAKHADKLKKSESSVGLKKILGNKFPKQVKGVAVFTNASCDATQGRKTPEGIRTRTLWGEIAIQLGGIELYKKIKANDESQRVPQGLFVEILQKSAPCLILLDELADYCVGAAAVPVGDTTLADQTISFIQQLTEAVQQVPGAVIVATLPASKEDVANSEKGQEAFVTLERRFQRLGADVKPVADDEIYEVVKTRLFERITPDDEKDYPSKVATAYHKMYCNHTNEVPNEATKATIKEQIEKSYPFHPSLIDGFYLRWGSHPDFQRTRGVLRLMACIIEDLWKRREGNTQSQILIQPCHIRWSLDPLNAALTRLWGQQFQTVVAADVIGKKSNAASIDNERGEDYEREKIAEGIASAILLGSFGGKGEKSGYSGKDLKYVCSRPSLNWNYTDGALVELENRCFFLHTTSAGSLGKRYWYSTKPTLTKLIVQYRQQYSSESFNKEILETLNQAKDRGAGKNATWRILVNPGKELPEQKSLTLIILSPEMFWNGDSESQKQVQKAILTLSQKCGERERIYRNTLVFLGASSRTLSKLRQLYRECAALKSVKSDYWDQLDTEDKDDLKKRIDTADKATIEALGAAYTMVYRVHGNEVEELTLPDARNNFLDHLGYIWNTLVEDEEWILRKAGVVTLKEAGLVPESGALRVKDAVEAFLKFTDKPIVADKEAITSSLTKACENSVIGIGRGANPNSLVSRNCGKSEYIDPTEDGLWIIPPFKEETKTTSVGTGEDIGSKSKAEISGEKGIKETTQTTGVANSKKIHKFRIQGNVPVESWADIFRSFVNPTTRMGLKKQKFGISFEFETDDQKQIDPNDPAYKAIQEAAKQLGLEIEEEN